MRYFCEILYFFTLFLPINKRQILLTGVYGGGENHVFGKRERIPWISAVFGVQSPFIRRQAARQRKKISSYAAAISERITASTKRDCHRLKPCESRPMAARGWRIMRICREEKLPHRAFYEPQSRDKNRFHTSLCGNTAYSCPLFIYTKQKYTK